MAERIVSPGVFTRERDLSFLPQAIGEIGAAIVGPTAKGPAFVPTQITSFQEYEEVFGTVDDRFYTPYTVQQYLRSAGVVTVVRVLGLGGYRADQIRLGVALGSVAKVVPSQSLAILAPSQGSSGVGDLSASSITGDWDSFTLTVSGSDVSAETYNLSFNTSSANFVTEVISENPQSSKSGNTDSSVYVYKVFKRAAHATASYTSGTKPNASIVVDSDGLDFYSGVTGIDDLGNATSWTGNQAYNTARTPYINSQGPNKTNLFRIYTRSHGDDINKSYKIGILNIKSAADIAGSDFGTFSIQVRVHSPGGLDDDNIVEQFDALTFDKSSPDFFAKRIGDRHVTIDSNGKLTYFGNYPNLSKHIRVGDYKFSGGNQALDAASPGAVPFGHNALYNPVEGDTDIPASVFNTSQTNTQGTFDQSIFYGFDLLNDNVKKISFWILVISGLFTFIAVLLINSSIRLAVYSKRFIIKTMQMVGATKSFIRRPFIWQSVKLGIIGAVLALIGMGIVLFYLNKSFPELELLRDSTLLIALFLGVFLMGIFITWLSTFFATSRFLNLKTDELYY